MKRSARITTHPSTLQNNLLCAKKHAPHSKTNAVIKANAYGHGAVETAGILYEIADGFAVSCIPEAVELRQAGIDLPITVLQGHQSMDDLRIAEAYQLRLTLHDKQQLSLLSHFSTRKQTRFDVNLKIDTAMHRLGFHPDEAKPIFQKLQKLTQVHPDNIVLMTHLACADELENTTTNTQLETFKQACELIETNNTSQKSIANSAGILAWEESHVDWIRPGIMLYGSSPFAEQSRDHFKLQAAMTLNAPVIAIHHLKKGDAIGYGATWKCSKDTSIAVIACGYADGYPRHAESGTPVFINNQEAKLVGRVSMDMIIVEFELESDVDVNNSKNSHQPIKVGDLAELWGDNISIDRVATHAETISYELLCNAGNLCERIGN